MHDYTAQSKIINWVYFIFQINILNSLMLSAIHSRFITVFSPHSLLATWTRLIVKLPLLASVQN